MKNLLVILVVLFSGFSAFSQEAKKFDDFGLVSCREAEERLRKFYKHLTEIGSRKGYIIYYEGQYYPIIEKSKKIKNKLARADEGNKRFKLYLDQVPLSGEFSGIKLVVVRGGFRQSFEVEFWVSEPNDAPPKPQPSIKPEDFKVRKGKITKKELRCQN